MPPTAKHRRAEAAFRVLVDDGHLVEPDEVEYTDEGVLFLWRDVDLSVLVEFDEVVGAQPQNTPSGSASISASNGATSLDVAA